ncbi:MAG: hypothetical protein ACP5PK_04735 [candidate division WOR-3 bacterium]
MKQTGMGAAGIRLSTKKVRVIKENAGFSVGVVVAMVAGYSSCRGKVVIPIR